MKSVLLTNAQLRKTLSAARSLGSKGLFTIISEETRLNPAAFSKYCGRSLAYPNPRQNPEEFYNWLVTTIKKYDCEVLFPMDDDTLEVVMQHKTELEKLCRLPLPPVESYLKASDKGSTVIEARRAGVDCPNTVMPEIIQDLTGIVSHMKFPLVIKPRRSSGSRGIRVVKNSEELVSEYMKIHSMFPYPIIQEYIGSGDRYDVCLLYDRNNQLKAAFVQKELRHFPIALGPSTVQESVLYPELVENAVRLMGNLKWFGVVELEFMIDQRDGKPKLMEINPRFWNSLQAAVSAGVDFPWLLYQLAMDIDFDNVFNYRTGVRCQWLLPGDVLHFVFNKERRLMNPPFLGGRKYNLQDDIISMKDPLPVLGFFLACLRYLFDINKNT